MDDDATERPPAPAAWGAPPAWPADPARPADGASDPWPAARSAAARSAAAPWTSPRPTRRRAARRRRLVALVLGPALLLGAAASAVLVTRPSGDGTPALQARERAGAGVVLRSAGDVSTAAADEAPPLAELSPADLPPAAPPAFAKAKAKPSTTVTPKDVHAALALRTAALRRHDEKAFLATFDPARPALVATERTLFRNLVKLPLVGPAYLETGVTGSATSRRAFVSLLHTYRGVDSESAELTKVETFVRRKGIVVTTAIGALRGQPATRYAPLDQVQLTVRDGALATVVATPDVDNLDEISRTAEDAASAVRAVWGSRPGPTRFVVFATHDQKAVGTWFGAGSAPFQAAGATMLQVAIRHPSRYTGARVIIDVTQAKGEALYRVLRHEFTHAVDARAQTVPKGAVQNFPTWAEEGMAAWVEDLDVPVGESTYVKALRTLRTYWNHKLPPDARTSFYVDGDRGAYNYSLAATVYRYIGTKWGTSKAVGFYTAFASHGASAAFSSLGTDRAGFVAGWSAWVDGQLG